MAAAPETLVPPGRLGRSQAARRARVLDTVLELGREGGYDAIQLRVVAERSGVASDTTYRYFGSRDRLIAAALGHWLEGDAFADAPTWGAGRTAAERLLAFCNRVSDLWQRDRNLIETLVRAELADDLGTDSPGARSRDVLGPLLRATLDGVDPSYADDVVMIIDHLTHSTMTFFVRERMAIDDVRPVFERAVRRLAQHPAMDGHRPRSWDPKRRGSRSA